MNRVCSLFGLLLLVLLIKNSTFSPVIITSETFQDFIDDWDYQIKPDRYPWLNITAKEHILPPLSQETNETELLNTTSLLRTPKKLGDAVRSRISCSVCKLGIGLLMKEIKDGRTFDEIKVKFVNLCVSFKFATADVCTGLFDVFGPEVIAAFNATNIGIPEVCGLLLGETCGEIPNPLHEWEIELPDIPKPPIEDIPLPKEGLPTYKILHISDVHYDPDYEEGTVSNCQEPLCCRKTSTPSDDPVIPAGKWGAYKACDSPKAILDHLFKHLAEKHLDVDFILWTGDLPPHDIWNQTKVKNLQIIEDSIQQLIEYFPSTPIFPAIGNHESSPAGSFGPPWVESEHSISWLYSELANHWRRWLPPSTTNTVLHGGFYSVLLRPNLRLISLNTNYCHTLSWWLVVNSTDPAHELKWLVHELQAAENNTEKVLLIGHIAPGSSDCLKVWSENFYKIVERYENTIIAQFYGHSHADEFEVFYDPNDLSKISPKNRRRSKLRNKTPYKFTGRPTGIAYLAPSVTTYDNFNPAYRIYHMDGEHENSTKEIIDHETWTIDLEEANRNGEPKWYQLYSARSAFHMKSLRPTEWSKLIDRMVEDTELFNQFYRYYYRESETRPSCDDPKCKLQLLCDLRSGKSQSRHTLCHDLELAFGS